MWQPAQGGHQRSLDGKQPRLGTSSAGPLGPGPGKPRSSGGVAPGLVPLIKLAPYDGLSNPCRPFGCNVGADPLRRVSAKLRLLNQKTISITEKFHYSLASSLPEGPRSARRLSLLKLGDPYRISKVTTTLDP